MSNDTYDERVEPQAIIDHAKENDCIEIPSSFSARGIDAGQIIDEIRAENVVHWYQTAAGAPCQLRGHFTVLEPVETKRANQYVLNEDLEVRVKVSFRLTAATHPNNTVKRIDECEVESL